MKKITLLFTLFCFALGFAQPDSAAPTPSKAAADVVSVYSDAYTSIAGNLDPFWGQATDASEVQINGNNTLQYAGLNYQGLDFPETDVSAMENLHLDYYTENSTTLEFFLISANPTIENSFSITIVPGEWQSIDIPLSVYTANLDRVFQFKTVGNGTVSFDNMYFWKAPAAQGTDTSLSDLTIYGQTIAGFGPTSTNYSVELPAGATVVPGVAAFPTDTNASAVVTAATSIPGTTTIVVTAQDGVTSSTISIAWSIDPKPSTGAPVPSQESADVVSVYSDAYTSIATTLNPGWGQATQATEVDIDGNNTLQYANLNYQGLEYPLTDVSAMEYLHLDYHTSDATSLDFFLISANPTVENAHKIDIVTGSWQSIDIPLSVYTANLDRVFQFKTLGNGTVWFDNMYFWKAPAAQGTDTSLIDLTVNGSTIANFGSLSATYSVELPVGTTVVPVVAVTTTDINASAVVTAATSIPGTTTIAITAQDGVTSSTVSIAFSIDPKPATAAPTPNQDSADVISVFSDAYTTNIAANLNPGWGQATQTTEVDIAGNNTLEYASLNYQGLEYPETDVSAMEYVHLDYYTNDATALDLYLISTGPLENAHTISVVTGSWQSIDIPLSAYTVPELDKAIQFKTEGNGTVWFDNIYFWKAPTVAGTQLADLTVDGSTITDFGASKTIYSVELSFGTTTVPTVAATTADTNASAVVTAATNIPGTTTIAITAVDGVTTSTVFINFSINSTPTTAAPTPTWESDDVISVYSDAYTTNIASNLNPGWGQGTAMAEIQIAGNNTMKYANLDYQGLEYPETDVSAMGYLRLDYFTIDATALQFFLVTNGVDATVENAYDIAASESFAFGEWVSLDIPLTVYSDAGQDLSKAIQFKTEGNGTVYLDNLYFFNSGEASVGSVEQEALRITPNPTAGSINKTGDIYNISGQKVLTNSNDLSGLPSGIYFIKVIENGNVSTSKIIKK
tara:strand:- start:6321 stop:9215 length:2895 start_codon:yes stop_codon:yes gene_type:complete